MNAMFTFLDSNHAAPIIPKTRARMNTTTITIKLVGHLAHCQEWEWWREK